MKDIQSREDIEGLVHAFYKQVLEDEEIGYFFTDIVKLDWEKHIPLMCNFWETVLLGKIKYKGNPILKHIELNKKEKLLPIHFERWIQLWKTTVQTHFCGIKAKEAIQKAVLMGELMKHKIEASKNNTFVQ